MSFRKGATPRRFIMTPKNGEGCCARIGRVGQAHIDLLALSANCFLELPQTQTKQPSEHKASTEQAP